MNSLSHMTPDRKAEVLAKSIEHYKELKTHLAKADALMLEMMRHPDATPEQLWEMHESCVRIHKQVAETRDALRKRFPDRGTFRIYPWNY